ncbi:MAG: preprotein translocase subunit YajC [Candidatus Kapaibacteriota bacterium]|jgi:preprotein translocase subunit YajC
MNLFLFAMSPAQGGDPTSQLFSTVIMFGSVIAIFYFMILRPQKKRENEHKSLMESLKKGDKIVMSSGIHGTVSEVDEDTLLVQIADNVRVRVNRVAVANVIPKAEK